METAADAAQEANRLYWETELPVAEIAARLDLSRRALYDMIRPVPADGQCARCGERLEFSNRSSRAHGFASCGRCGLQASAARLSTPEVEPWTWSPPSRTVPPEPAGPRPLGVWWLGAAALAGALLGAAATLGVVRRS